MSSLAADLDVSGIDTRSKLRTLPKPVNSLTEVPTWRYDSSRIGQAQGEDGQVILRHRAIFKDPFRGGRNILVMCDASTSFCQPVSTNKSYVAAQIFSRPEVIAEKPWFGIEQEYTLLQKDVIWPIGLPVGKALKGSCYCGVGTDKAFGRAIADSHYNACLNAGINISGFNPGVMPGQWAFLVGPTLGISAGDELWVARYILQRITEDVGVVLSFNPKPGIWEEASAPMNYSTKSMRTNGGYEVIKKAIEKLGLRHMEHPAAYGFTERLKTADIDPFFWDVGNRSSRASIHVSRETKELGKGYFEDRRPASSMDPYVATSMTADTTILWKP